MDDLTPWVYWGVGPDQAWRDAAKSGLIEVLGYFREAGREGREGEWVEMTAEEYELLVRDYTRRRAAFQGPDEEAEILKVWSLGRFVGGVGGAVDAGGGDGEGGREFVIDATRMSQDEGGLGTGAEQEMEVREADADGVRGDGEEMGGTGGGHGDAEGMAVCVVGREEEVEALTLSLRSVLLALPTWKVRIYSPPTMARVLRRRLMPVIALARAAPRVDFGVIDEFSGESFARNSSTHVLWSTHHATEDGRVRVLFDGGIHYDTLFKTRSFWEGIPAEHILIFQADSLLCELSPWTIHDFLEYDFVGAPWRQDVCPPDNDRSVSICWNDYVDMVQRAGFFNQSGYKLPSGQGGNGGLSLRKRSKMLEIVEKCRHVPSMEWNEDVFFSFPCPHVSIALPTTEVASRFAVESGPFYERPFGVHKVWRHRALPDLVKLSDACVWLPPLVALSGVVLSE